MKQQPKDRSWPKLSFGEKKLKKFSTFSKKSKTKFSRKCEFWPEFFFLRTNQKVLRNPNFSTFGTILVTDPKNLEKFSKFSIFFFTISLFLIFNFFLDISRCFKPLLLMRVFANSG